ncbi:uracil-DNA glycosylase [Phenylobacterium sp.]|uniref:uracil-DNA glycosylase n=1 Tax=Phenylobacterium sp. TaxID=1871053 RepID=UPI0039194FBC
MTPARQLPDDAALESLLAFWADGGVDAMLLDAPFDRIEAGRILPPAPAARPIAALAPGPGTGPVARGQPDVSAAIAQAQALAAEAQDMEALAAAIAAFEGCPLRFEGAATKAVCWRGSLEAPLMVVGEGPGAEEDVQGLPFVGRAGKLLDKMLAAAGLADRVLITNTVFWRPPGNRTPAPHEQMICAPFLERAITLVRPKMLLLVGGASAKSMLKKDEGILSLRGRWFEWKSSDGAVELPAMPTLHPAFLLRQPGAKKRAWSDLLTLTERLDRPERPA